MVSLSYSDISNQGFDQAIQKLLFTPMHGARASVLHSLGKKLSAFKKQIHKEWKETIVAKYAQKDEKGEAVVDPLGNFVSLEALKDESESAQKAFFDQVFTLEMDPITPEFLGDARVSAADLQALAGLYRGNEKEAEKSPASVTSIR